jgi:hypothetical protein
VNPPSSLDQLLIRTIRDKRTFLPRYSTGRRDYDPNIISFRDAAELGELVREADAGGKILYVNLGY